VERPARTNSAPFDDDDDENATTTASLERAAVERVVRAGAPPPSPAPPDHAGSYKPGFILDGKYRIERVVAEGGMGIVYEAFELAQKTRVAIKVMGAAASADEGAVERFRREARAAMRIRSDHVAKVFNIATASDGCLYIVMEFLDGGTLAERFEAKQPFAVDEAVKLALQMVDGLAAAHALGIVHRDVKPANMMLTSRPGGATQLTIVDFGMSKFSIHGEHGEREDLTRVGMMLGTPMFMAPEQFMHSKVADKRADLWAVGAILYEMLADVHPFEAPTLLAHMTRLTTPAKSLRSIDPSIPEALDAAVLRCLERDPALRFQDAGELRAALAPFATLPEAPPSAAPTAGEQRDRTVRLASAALQDSTREMGTRTDPAPPPPRQRRKGIVVVALLVLALLLTAAWLYRLRM
jgi:serine/threonine-protein kinase